MTSIKKCVIIYNFVFFKSTAYLFQLTQSALNLKHNFINPHRNGLNYFILQNSVFYAFI